ncbi:MAG: EamA family transporter [Caldilineaceae bacterium]
MTAEERRGLLLVALAVVLFSTSPVLIRWAAASLTSYEITAGRLLVAGVIVLGLAVLRKDPLPLAPNCLVLSGTDWRRRYTSGCTSLLYPTRRLHIAWH